MFGLEFIGYLQAADGTYGQNGYREPTAKITQYLWEACTEIKTCSSASIQYSCPYDTEVHLKRNGNLREYFIIVLANMCDKNLSGVSHCQNVQPVVSRQKETLFLAGQGLFFVKLCYKNEIVFGIINIASVNKPKGYK